MNHTKTFEAINKLKDIELELHRLKNALEMANKALDSLCAPQPKQDNTYVYASSLATAIWQKHYMKESPQFALLDTTEGVLTQINNMTCGLVREKPAQPEQDHDALDTH
jgi:hypothetical protein